MEGYLNLPWVTNLMKSGEAFRMLSASKVPPMRDEMRDVEILDVWMCDVEMLDLRILSICEVPSKTDETLSVSVPQC